MARGPENEKILFANEAFYAAFASGDVEAMNGVWADDAPVVCLHPGATPIYDRAEIMRSWDHILSDPGVSDMQMHSPRVLSYDNVALVICYETLGGGTLIATNAFVREGGQWRMVSHQAGPCPDAPEDEDLDDEEAGPSLH
ncbi:MAG: nuclear transport factor 2 family protein [Rhodospirillales bacterium]|nr:nuclear transport factor 2 family protein [Rhodospirillales bacterium]